MLSLAAFPNCCGLWLLHGEGYYQTAEAFFKDLASVVITRRDAGGIFSVGGVMFEHSADKDIGKKIAAYVEEHKLGVVECLSKVANPVHGGREFYIYLWKHDRTALRAHLVELVKPPAPAPVPAVPFPSPSEFPTAVPAPIGHNGGPPLEEIPVKPRKGKKAA